jgi:hypothetical protein
VAGQHRRGDRRRGVRRRGALRVRGRGAARRNSDRPEQGQWWAATAKLFDGEPTFANCRDVDELLGGGSDDAGFVQVIQGRAIDQDRLRELGKAAEEFLRAARPEIIGGTTGWHGDGEFTEIVYFTSEKEALEAEGRETPESLQGPAQEYLSLMTDMRYYDLRGPWTYGP